MHMGRFVLCIWVFIYIWNSIVLEYSTIGLDTSSFTTQHRVVIIALVRYYQFSFLISNKPLIAYLSCSIWQQASFLLKILQEKWPSDELFPQRLAQLFPTTSRLATCHNSTGMIGKSRSLLGGCKPRGCWHRATFPSSATQLLSWEL